MKPHIRIAMTATIVAGLTATTGILTLRRTRVVGAPDNGVQVPNAENVADTLIDDAERDDELRREVRRSVLLKLGAVLTLVLALVFLVAYAVALVTRPESPLSVADVFAIVYHVSHGRLSPEIALQAVLGAAAVCVTINVSLAVDANIGGRRRQIANSAWRSSLSTAAVILAMGSVVIGHAVWANINVQTDFGTALTANFFSIVALLLAITSHQQVNSVERASGVRRATKNLKDLDSWHLELTRRGLPLGANKAAHSARETKFPWRTLRAYGFRLMVLGVIATLYPGVLLAIGVAVRLSTGHGPVFSWWMLKILSLYWLYAMVAFLVVGIASFLRWTMLPPTRPRWLLDVTAHVVRWGYGLLASFLIAAEWISNGVDSGLFSFGLFFVSPAIAWWTLWSSRRRPDAAVPRFLGGPFWELIEWWIQNNRRIHQHQRDKLLRDEIDERWSPGLSSFGPRATRSGWEPGPTRTSTREARLVRSRSDPRA
jgi:hypothetical protein